MSKRKSINLLQKKLYSIDSTIEEKMETFLFPYCIITLPLFLVLYTIKFIVFRSVFVVLGKIPSPLYKNNLSPEQNNVTSCNTTIYED